MPADPSHITRVYEEHRDGLRSFFRSHAHRKDTVDDLVQEVYVTLIRFPPREIVRDPAAYLYKVAWHVLQRGNKRTRREAQAHDPALLEDLSRASYPDAAAEVGAEQQLIALLKELPPLYGAVLILNRRDGLDYEQVSRRLGISVSQVRRYLGVTLAHLKQAQWNE